MTEQAKFPELYTFDSNRRVYPKTGVMSNRPIFAEHFRLIEIVSETDKEYICRYGTINKRSMMLKQGSHRMETYTNAERLDMIWKNDHHYKLMRVIDRVKDVATLKKIAALVGGLS